MRWYRVFFALLLPWIFLRHLWQGRPDFSFQQQQSRLGLGIANLDNRLVIHAVSVGELNAALPLIRALAAKNIPLVVTLTTFTAARLAKRLLPEAVPWVFFPYDVAFLWCQAFAKVRGFLLVETELWPLHLAYCQRQGIPVLLINGRLSARSFTRYQRHSWLARQLFPKLTMVLAQSPADATRFQALGAGLVQVVGNLKNQGVDQEDQRYLNWQNTLPQDFWERPLWLAASVHRGEEAVILAAHQQLQQQFPNALLCLVPRHPARFSPKDFRGFHTAWRSQIPLENINQAFEVLVIDGMGELQQWCYLFPVVLMGGSFKKIGGHNPLEPAAAGCAVITGPYFFHFQSIFEQLFAAQALKIAKDASALALIVQQFWQESGAFTQAGAAAKAVFDRQPDALAAHWQALAAIFSLPALPEKF